MTVTTTIATHINFGIWRVTEQAFFFFFVSQILIYSKHNIDGILPRERHCEYECHPRASIIACVCVWHMFAHCCCITSPANDEAAESKRPSVMFPAHVPCPIRRPSRSVWLLSRSHAGSSPSACQVARDIVLSHPAVFVVVVFVTKSS